MIPSPLPPQTKDSTLIPHPKSPIQPLPSPQPPTSFKDALCKDLIKQFGTISTHQQPSPQQLEASTEIHKIEQAIQILLTTTSAPGSPLDGSTQSLSTHTIFNSQAVLYRAVYRSFGRFQNLSLLNI